jgi:hypothetical protein
VNQAVRTLQSLALGALLLFSVGCETPPKQTVEVKPEPPKIKQTPEAIAINDTAKFLAGLPGRAESPLKAAESTDAWKKYAQEFEQIWKDNEDKRLNPARQFQKEFLEGKTKREFVFYPFSGPDVMYMRAFFPHGKSYVMAGLEPAGTLKPVSTYAQNLDRETARWKVTLSSIFNRSFFVTSEMDRQARGQVFDGLLPIMAILLARTNHEIDAIRYIKLLPDGSIEDDPVPMSQTIKRRGLELAFHQVGESESRKLYYFSTNLGDNYYNMIGPGLKENPGFINFSKKLGRCDTFVKSASFVPHWGDTTLTRGFMLDSSDSVLQDDTGTPLKFYRKMGGWQEQFFGEYSRPDPPFRNHYQPEVAAEFASGEKVKPLSFNIGYGAGKRPSSLMFFTKK